MLFASLWDAICRRTSVVASFISSTVINVSGESSSIGRSGIIFQVGEYYAVTLRTIKVGVVVCLRTDFS